MPARSARVRTRRATRVTRLPHRAYVVREKHLRRFRTLARQLTDIPLSPDTTFDGLLNMGEDGNEIWVEAGLPEPDKRFTIIHELVHARRQQAGEDLDDDALEEQIVELEALARARRRLLNRMSSGTILSLLHDYLTRRGRDDPNTSAGLAAVHKRIRMLLGVGTGRPRTTARAWAAHRRPVPGPRSRRPIPGSRSRRRR